MKLTEDTILRICEIVQDGNFIAVAAEACGIARATVYVWLKNGEREGEPEDSLYRLFLELYKEARAKSQIRDVKCIRKAAETNWTAAAWRLERSDPEHWARRPAPPETGETDELIVIE